MKAHPQKKKKTGLVNKIILLLNGMAILALLMAYISPYINPEKVWFPAFFGLALPYLLVMNLLFVIYWIIFQKWFALLSLFAIAAGFKQHRQYFNFHPGPPIVIDSSFKLLTFNTHNLTSKESMLPDSMTRHQVLSYLVSESPDVLCLQEFTSIGKDHRKLFTEWSNDLYLPCFYHDDYFEGRSDRTNALVTFSSFPILNAGTLRDDKGKAYCIFTDLAIPEGDTIRIFNVHLQSVKFHRKDYEFVKDITTPVHIDQDLKEGSYSIARKLRNAFRQRSAHVLHLKEQLAASPYPVVVCGDFNDTPTSFAYRQIKSNLKDTFLESGNGYAYTFKGNFPVPLRIDYILVSESIRSSSYYTRKIALSDHLPVAAILNLTD